MKTLILLLLCSTSVFAKTNLYEFIAEEKQEAKSKSRWSISQWLDTKKRNNLMDQWLQLNTNSTRFEFYFTGSLVKVKDQQALYYQENSYQRFGFGAFFHMVGVEYSLSNFSSGSSNLEYLASFRLLGSSLQSTNLIISYGRNVREDGQNGDLSNDFWQLRSNVYLVDFLGLDLAYRKTLSNNNVLNSQEVSGDRLSVNAFVEIGLARFFIESFKETNDITILVDGSKQEIINEGTMFGIKLFL